MPNFIVLYEKILWTFNKLSIAKAAFLWYTISEEKEVRSNGKIKTGNTNDGARDETAWHEELQFYNLKRKDSKFFISILLIWFWIRVPIFVCFFLLESSYLKYQARSIPKRFPRDGECKPIKRPHGDFHSFALSIPEQTNKNKWYSHFEKKFWFVF